MMESNSWGGCFCMDWGLLRQTTVVIAPGPLVALGIAQLSASVMDGDI
jgi:hypothetical protein